MYLSRGLDAFRQTDELNKPGKKQTKGQLPDDIARLWDVARVVQNAIPVVFLAGSHSLMSQRIGVVQSVVRWVSFRRHGHVIRRELLFVEIVQLHTGIVCQHDALSGDALLHQFAAVRRVPLVVAPDPWKRRCHWFEHVEYRVCDDDVVVDGDKARADDHSVTNSCKGKSSDENWWAPYILKFCSAVYKE